MVRKWIDWYRRQSGYKTFTWTEKYLGGHVTLSFVRAALGYSNE